MNEKQLIDSLVTFIGEKSASEEEFNSHALEVFNYQFDNNSSYQLFCRQRGKTPKSVRDWRSIPALPINAYKNVTLSCCNPEDVKRTFMTSGTTQVGQRGKCHHPTLTVYDLSMVKNFKARFIPEFDEMRMAILFPTENEMPNSSLAHYLELALMNFGSDGSRHFVNASGIRIEELFTEIDHAEKIQEPFALLGASYSFVHLMEEMKKFKKFVKLPDGSRILDTGGFKGQSPELHLNEFYSNLEKFFGVSRDYCINMYGMTELSTQFYDDGNRLYPSIKSGPHWIRSQVINPLTGITLPKGEKGVLMHCDLAHFNCISAILTEDMGIEVDDGFILMGRAKGAEAKGCSMAVEEFLAVAQG